MLNSLLISDEALMDQIFVKLFVKDDEFYLADLGKEHRLKDLTA